MIEIARILCPIDFSDFSRRAFDHAVALARWYGSTITLLHVYSSAPVAAYAPGSPMHPAVALTPTDREAILAAMRRFAEEEVGPTATLEYEAREGAVASEILAAADASDLIVMGTHGRSGFERLLLGSITERVLRKAVCPVLTVPRRTPDAVPSAPALFTNILCATDFSDCATHALNHAMSLAQEASARLTVLHVVEVLPEWPRDTDGAIRARPRDMEAYVAEIEQEREERLRAAVPESVRMYCTVDTVLARGAAYREIVRVAAERRSDLIVLGIHGRGATDLLFFGSTTQHVVRQASCPVLTVRRE